MVFAKKYYRQCVYRLAFREKIPFHSIQQNATA